MGHTRTTMKHHYQTHIFCCVNKRDPDHPRSCCSARGSIDLHRYMKQRSKELGIKNIRVNQSGCMERCELGPTMVIYPEGVWYGYSTKDDVDEILNRHVIGGERVERLLLEPGQIVPKPKIKQTLTVQVSQITKLTPDIKRFELIAKDGGELPSFEAGAHIDVLTGNGLRRSYSLTNRPGERHRYVLGVLREKESRGGSAWVHEDVRVGDTLTVVAPLNNFKLANDAAQHILIAGGIGITPILAMGHELMEREEKFTLHYCTKSPKQTAFMDEVCKAFGDRVIFHHDGGDPSKGIKLDRVLGRRPAGAHVYICGPKGLMNAARDAAAHWPEEAVHFEHFVASARPDNAKNEPFEISLSRHKLQLTVPPEKSILEVIREHGIYVDSSCEQGICSTCRVGLLGGGANHRDEVLSSKEKKENIAIMVCVSRAKKGEMLILDL